MSEQTLVENVYNAATEGNGCAVKDLISALPFEERRSILNHVAQRSREEHAAQPETGLPNVTVFNNTSNANKLLTSLQVGSNKEIYHQRRWFGTETEYCRDIRVALK